MFQYRYIVYYQHTLLQLFNMLDEKPVLIRLKIKTIS